MLLKKKKKNRNSLFLWSLVLVGGWWYCAFTPPSKAQNFEIALPASQEISHQPYLTPICRDQLKDALSGNVGLMASLISQWDLDAELLESKGYAGIKRLPRESFIRSQLLVRRLCVSTNKDKSATFLPQTYLATSFLLALTTPRQIAALPNGVRSLTQIFSKELTSQIPFDISRYNAEKLFLSPPSMAFTAEFSHPIWKTIFNQQSIPFCVIKVPESPEAIGPTLVQIGQLIDRPLESELLATFIEAALLAIDNQIWGLQEIWRRENRTPSILFAQYHSQLTLPTARTLTGHLLKRSNLFSANETESAEWAIPLRVEQLVQMNPDCLIISTSMEKQSILKKNFTALARTKLVFVDDILQQFPSQYIVLAYYDLYNALAQVLPL